jgi:hypothetical protein
MEKLGANKQRNTAANTLFGKMARRPHKANASLATSPSRQTLAVMQ